MEWKSGISQIPREMAEKGRKCGIIPPKRNGWHVWYTKIAARNQKIKP